ncbi:hypothetical protein B0H13DRAFT_1879288 [Mycena leptocephala]|nr:hypothetical protein B0H13DRAFT_1879288 [Mycena leptocephala]
MKLGPKLNAKIISIYWWTNWDRGPSVHEQDGQTGSTDVPWGFELKSPAKWAAVNCPILPRRVLAIKLSNGSSSGFSVMNLHTLHEGTVNVDKDGNWTLLNNFELGDAIANDEREGDKDQMGAGCEDETHNMTLACLEGLVAIFMSMDQFGLESTYRSTHSTTRHLVVNWRLEPRHRNIGGYFEPMLNQMRERKKMKAYKADSGGKRPQYVTQEGTPVKSKLHRPALGRDEDDERGGGKA